MPVRCLRIRFRSKGPCGLLSAVYRFETMKCTVEAEPWWALVSGASDDDAERWTLTLEDQCGHEVTKSFLTEF
jgi:hypothetical protein